MPDEVVIARYLEDLDWVAQIPGEFQVVIYNKGADITSAPALRRADQVVRLRNSGRESDTFLRHILDPQQPFGDGCTVFLQGDPFEHSPDIIQLLAARPAWSGLQPLSWRWIGAEEMPPAELLARETEGFIAGARVRPERYSLSTWGPLQFFDPGTKRVADDYARLHGLPAGSNIAADFFRRCEWDDLAAQAEGHLVGCFAYGAMFAVRQSRLMAAPRRSLELALEAANAHQTYGYILERLWLHMFGQPFQLDAAPSKSGTAEGRPGSGFVAQPAPPAVPALHRRIVPAVKRRILSWAQA